MSEVIARNEPGVEDSDYASVELGIVTHDGTDMKLWVVFGQDQDGPVNVLVMLKKPVHKRIYEGSI